MSKPAFEVDKRGLEKLLARRGKEFAVLELVQNALDENVTEVNVSILPIEGSRGYHLLMVEDNSPEGFSDLSHAYTLFAESGKKINPEQRGRFNLGEKLVLACCRKAQITTTTGRIEWDSAGRTHSRHKTHEGSVFTGEIRMNRDEAQRSINAVERVLVPEGVKLTVNERPVPSRTPLFVFEATLPTEIADEEGFLRRTARKTTVRAFEAAPGESPALYEMGIPVVEVEGAWHIDIGQKIPLNTDRDNVTPAYLRKVRAEVLNHGFEKLPEEAARGSWVNDAMESGEVEPEAVGAVLTARYGDRRVVRDPSDPESTHLAVAKGYSVIEPGTFSRGQWDTIRRAGTHGALPSGQVTPSPKPFSKDGRQLNLVPEEKWTVGMKLVARVSEELAETFMAVSLSVRIASDVTWPVSACYARVGPNHGELTFNLGRLGHKFFSEKVGHEQLRLIIHEFGHQYASNHLSEEYHDAICDLGARMALGAVDAIIHEHEHSAKFTTHGYVAP